MTSATTRVRFAPSPTGYLHIGGARTALFNWLFARATGGAFLLRIEDTDRERSLPQFTDDIMESLRWLALDWDEEPVFQSNRLKRYREAADRLLSRGLAYRCECTPEHLGQIRADFEKRKQPFRYPGTCRNKGIKSEQSVVRLLISSVGETMFEDCIRGQISFRNADIDDWVIQRTDGTPTYNFAVVVDDSDQRITHVLRGDDHINNTPKQLHVYKSLGLTPPLFAHLPMILGPDRTKLSKRHGAASTLEYRKMGYLPEAVINFLVRLGWSHGDQELFTVDELKKYFSLDKIGKANAIFNQEKLNWISGQLFRNFAPERLAEYITRYFADETSFLREIDPPRITQGISIIQGKVKTVIGLIEQLKCLFGADPAYSTLPATEILLTRERLEAVLPVFERAEFTKASIEAAARELVTNRSEKLAEMASAIRYAVTGGRVSPGLFEMLELQGQETVLRRIRAALIALPSP